MNLLHIHVPDGWGNLEKWGGAFFLGKRPESGKYLMTTRPVANAVACIYVDQQILAGPQKCESRGIPLALLAEPREVIPNVLESIDDHPPQFAAFITHDDSLLSRQDISTVVFSPGGNYLNRVPSASFRKKNKWLSISASRKNRTSGHKFRHEIIEALGHRHDLEVMGNGYRPYKDPSRPYKRFVFTIAVENSLGAHYFTEKLIHPMVLGCLPVYWGATILPEGFDEGGILRFWSLEGLLQTLENLASMESTDINKRALRNYSWARKFMSADVNLWSSVDAALRRVF